MEIVIASELIAGAVFVVGFWFKNPELKLSRLSKQFEVAFGEANGESSSVIRVCRPDNSSHSEGEPASVGAGLPRDGGQKIVHAASEDQCGWRHALIAGDVSNELQSRRRFADTDRLKNP